MSKDKKRVCPLNCSTASNKPVCVNGYFKRIAVDAKAYHKRMAKYL